ncbi:uncharacterized protein LOC128243601 isoform X1 [Mya arenaria]|uniref:uncharacterized protein LOC128243601 isoform X1 n=1 Tax=Mya arenaria TaxID=6604 RepID=UPI0022E07E1F|nr:uncharacterized protein LOC128243601 isoform X1 [Mya arenaria]
MPADQKLYGLPGPQNSAVLMDIISKLKQDLHQSRLENSKLVDQLNCLIALVKRAWGGEQSAIIHLANIVGMEAPNFSVSDFNRNTPIPDKTRAVQNWERFAVRLLERDYQAIRHEIAERQKFHIQRREMYIADVLEDHKHEMGKFQLHKKSTPQLEDVDKQFIRCYSAKTQGDRRVKSAGHRRGGQRGQLYRAADMIERAGVTVDDLLGQTQGPTDTDQVFNGLHKMGDNERLLYRPREHFDDPNRYKQGNLFDPNVIFSPEMMGNKKRPSSASESSIGGGYGVRTGSRARSGSAVKQAQLMFLTEEKPNRPLKYETTRPISGKRRPLSGNPATRGRIKSAPARRAVPPTVVRKDLHSKSAHDFGDDGSTEQNDELQDIGRRNSTEYNISENDFDLRSDGVESQSEVVEDKPPMAVRVKKGHPMDKFVEDLRMVSEMEETFKKTALQLQKKLGLETSGFV